MSAIDFDKVKGAAARLAQHAGPPLNGRCLCNGCEGERRYASDAVPGLLTEIERLKTLAREGWEHSRNMARAVSLTTIEATADAALKEIEAAS